MQENRMLNYLNDVLGNMPADWLNLTTHRLDIFDEKLAKIQFLEEFEELFESNNSSISALAALPTAFDYIRLGHPLSCILEWAIAKMNNSSAHKVISFSSRTAPVLAVLRKNLFSKRRTRIVYANEWPADFDVNLLRRVYGYNLEVKKVESLAEVNEEGFEGSSLFFSQQEDLNNLNLNNELKGKGVDFVIHTHAALGSVIIVNDEGDEDYISEIQHVRRRETIAMTPANCVTGLKLLLNRSSDQAIESEVERNKSLVLHSVKTITQANTPAVVGSCGLSIQYAIMMGLINDALDRYPGKAIKIVVPPNCYGGTNDQARRVAACIDNVEIVDLPVDGDNDMVDSTERVLSKIASEDAVPFIIAEIPTNPRVEVPDLLQLKEVLSKVRRTNDGETAIEPVFILDQTFCPNVLFLENKETLAAVKTISYVSGSKFPSGGKCTAGYCVANEKAAHLLEKVERHLRLCDNQATDLQLAILAEQMPSMNERIRAAYNNTREFVNHIQEVLPEAKINFVSKELAQDGFTPSVFSLDLPTKGETEEEREKYKRELNRKLIRTMITEIPEESKHCVSYGQLKGCYWTIPATSTQGTTKEGDKDYIARVSLSPNMDVKRHKQVFTEFARSL